MINLGYYIAMNKMYHLGISYDYGNKRLLVVIDGKVIYNDNHDFRFMCQHNMQIGYNSFSNSKYMIGKITYVQIL
jgi:hypothetical protein